MSPVFFVYLVFTTLVVLTIFALFLMWLDDYIPKRHTKIYGTRLYRISFTYTEFDKFGFKDKSQLGRMKFFLDKVVSHITMNEMWEHYSSRKLVQSWADDYYTNVWCLYKMYKSLQKGHIKQDEYDDHVDNCERRNEKIIEHLRRFNEALVKELDQKEDLLDELRQNGEFDEEYYSSCTVEELREYLDDGQEDE